MEMIWQITESKMDLTPVEIAGESVVDVLVGTKRHRPTAKPSTENRQYLERVVSKAIEEGRPIKIMSMWSACKAYGQFEYDAPDLLDVLALRRFDQIRKSVSKFHAPEIQVEILVEDYTEFRLNGYGNRSYWNGLIDLKNHLNLDYISVVRESQLISENFKESVNQNALAIFRGRESSVGWQGKIPWSHYLKRVATELPDGTYPRLRWQVALYLGICLARYQHGVHLDHDVKLSFSPYPSGVPDSLRKGRVEHKLKESRNNHETVAPWCAFSMLHKSGWSSVTVNQARARDYVSTTVHVNGFPIRVLI